MDEEALKRAFSKIKQDIFSLGSEVSDLRSELFEIKSILKSLTNIVDELRIQQIKTSTHNLNITTDPNTSTDASTHPQETQGLKYPNLGISTGNRGVSTDRQTNQQTDISTQITHKTIEKPIDQTILEASEALDSLDSIKKEIRIKFKTITQQEMLVFSTIYQLEDQGIKDINYNILAKKLNLSQSSIRDYVQRIINKGIPIIKTKLNNKKIILKISPKLKKIASLQTIIRLREI